MDKINLQTNDVIILLESINEKLAEFNVIYETLIRELNASSTTLA